MKIGDSVTNGAIQGHIVEFHNAKATVETDQGSTFIVDTESLKPRKINFPLPCDYCGSHDAHWFKQTSVAVCRKKECYDKCKELYEEILTDTINYGRW